MPGHPDCRNSKQPPNNLSLVEDLIASGEGSKRFNWQNFKHQNELVLNKLDSLGDRLEYEVIDAYYFNILRPDQHRLPNRDCLHSCSPGKVDVYNRLLLHFFRQTRGSQDVKSLQQALADFPWNRSRNVGPDGFAYES